MWVIYGSVSHHIKAIWWVTLTTLCFLGFLNWARKIFRQVEMKMLRMIVIFTILLFHLLLFLLIFLFLFFILHVVVNFMMLVDLGRHQLLLNLIILVIHVQRLNNLHLLLFHLEKGMLELELFEPLFGLLLDLVLDTVDVEFLLM